MASTAQAKDLASAIGWTPPENWPARSRAECKAILTAPGMRFEMEEVDIRGVKTRVWKNAPPNLRAIALLGDTVRDGAQTTVARLLWDDLYLYVGFTAFDPHISAVLTERDNPVSRDDCVEVFIAPDTSALGNYYNFEFNALGTILDR